MLRESRTTANGSDRAGCPTEPRWSCLDRFPTQALRDRRMTSGDQAADGEPLLRSSIAREPSESGAQRTDVVSVVAPSDAAVAEGSVGVGTRWYPTRLARPVQRPAAVDTARARWADHRCLRARVVPRGTVIRSGVGSVGCAAALSARRHRSTGNAGAAGDDTIGCSTWNGLAHPVMGGVSSVGHRSLEACFLEQHVKEHVWGDTSGWLTQDPRRAGEVPRGTPGVPQLERPRWARGMAAGQAPRWNAAEDACAPTIG